MNKLMYREIFLLVEINKNDDRRAVYERITLSNFIEILQCFFKKFFKNESNKIIFTIDYTSFHN